MANEQKYRELLLEAQAAIEPIRAFLDAVKAAPALEPNVRVVMLVEAAEGHARTLEQELDEIWDLLKRTI